MSTKPASTLGELSVGQAVDGTVAIFNGTDQVCRMQYLCEVGQAWFDAALIVRAFNAHEELVKAAKLALPLLILSTTDVAPERTKMLEAAIAKAEGK